MPMRDSRKFRVACVLPTLMVAEISLLATIMVSCATEEAPPPPEEELEIVEAEQPVPEEYVEEYVPEPAPEAPLPAAAPPPPTWQYGYTAGYFNGTVYTPGIYNFGTEVTKDAQVYYARSCDCVYAQSNGQIIGIVTKGDHPLAYAGGPIVKITDGAMILPRALVQDPLKRAPRENGWKN